MRILQQFPLADDPSLAGAVSAVLQRIIAVRARPCAISARQHARRLYSDCCFVAS
jgi:hypothetical protein